MDPDRQGTREPGSAGGLSDRPEFEWPVSGPRLDPLRFATTPFRRALGKAEQRGLGPRFTTDVRRTVIPLSFPDSTMARLCIDVGEVRTDDGEPVLRAPMHEIEIELEAGDPRRLYELAHTLAADVPLTLEPRPKPSVVTRCATSVPSSRSARRTSSCRARARGTGVRRDDEKLPRPDRRQRAGRADVRRS